MPEISSNCPTSSMIVGQTLLPLQERRNIGFMVMFEDCEVTIDIFGWLSYTPSMIIYINPTIYLNCPTPPWLFSGNSRDFFQLPHILYDCWTDISTSSGKNKHWIHGYVWRLWSDNGYFRLIVLHTLHDYLHKSRHLISNVLHPSMILTTQLQFLSMIIRLHVLTKATISSALSYISYIYIYIYLCICPLWSLLDPMVPLLSLLSL